MENVFRSFREIGLLFFSVQTNVKEIVIRLGALCRAACLNCKVDSYNSKLLKGLPFVAGYGLQVLVNKSLLVVVIQRSHP